MSITKRQTLFTIFASISAIVAFYLVYTWSIAQQREKDVLKITTGMNRDIVESFIGKEIWKADPKTCDCNKNCTQSIYLGNPSIWVMRFEDYLSVCYSNNVVISTKRYGL